MISVPYDKMPEIYSKADLFTLPSATTEAFGHVIVEAMASGLPIVTTPVGAIPSVLRSGETAIFVNPGDTAGIADAILTLLRDAGLRARIAEADFQTVRAQCSLEAVSQGLTTIYARYRARVPASTGALEPATDDPPRTANPR